MAFTHGKSCIIKVTNVGGGLITLTSYIQNGGSDQSVETDDTTVMGATDRAHVVGLKDNGNVSLAGPFDGTAGTVGAHATFSGLLGQAATAIEYHPQGTAVSNPKLTGNASVVKYNVTSDVGAANKYSAELKWNGTATWGTN